MKEKFKLDSEKWCMCRKNTKWRGGFCSVVFKSDFNSVHAHRGISRVPLIKPPSKNERGWEEEQEKKVGKEVMRGRRGENPHTLCHQVRNRGRKRARKRMRNRKNRTKKRLAQEKGFDEFKFILVGVSFFVCTCVCGPRSKPRSGLYRPLSCWPGRGFGKHPFQMKFEKNKRRW